MQYIFDNAKQMGEFIWPVMLVFGLLALATKRERILAAMATARREFTTNLGLAVCNTILLTPLFAIPGGAVEGWLAASPTLVQFWVEIPNLFTLVAALLALDLAAYWRHRLEHTRWFWPIHATHHADEAMQWLTLLRKHPLGNLVSVLLDGVFALVLGFPLGLVILAGVIRTWWGFFTHADVPWTLGIVGEVLISPAAHRVHHIRDEKLMGSNFGNTVTLWDRLFGTYVDPKDYINCATGIAEGSRGLIGELARPFERRYWKRRAEDDEGAPAS